MVENFAPTKVAHVTTIDMSLRYLLLNQMRSIQHAGYEVVGISSPGPDVPTIEAAGIRHIPVSMTRRVTPLADLVSLWRLYQVMRRERFTIVHTHNPKPGLLGQLAAHMAGVPIVVNTVHGLYLHDHMHPLWRRFYIAMEKIAARCSDVILSQNRDDIQTAIKARIWPPEKTRLLGNGIDLARFNPDLFSESDIARKRVEVGLPDGVSVVGFVGRLAAQRKGFLAFLQAANLIIQICPQVRFLIIGEADRGKNDALGLEIAEENGISQACIILGWKSNSELPILYLLMDTLVLPSLFEGFPRSVMEASAMGIPAVVTNVKGNREAVEQGRNGILVPLGDISALAEAIIELLADPQKAQRMGREGRRMALERFDEQRVFEQVKAEYVHLLRAKGLLPPRSSRFLRGGAS
jgi:glycosyltransferase involved in cell wall biosynthesis